MLHNGVVLLSVIRLIFFNIFYFEVSLKPKPVPSLYLPLHYMVRLIHHLASIREKGRERSTLKKKKQLSKVFGGFFFGFAKIRILL